MSRRAPARRLALAASLGLALSAGVWPRPAAADDATAGATDTRRGRIEDGEHGYTVTVPRGWRPIDGAAALLAYRAPDGHVVALTRLDAGTRVLGAGTPLADALERGVRRDTAGYRRDRRRQRTLGHVEVVDLAYRRDHPGPLDAVTLRFLVMRSRTLALTVAGPTDRPRAARRAAEALVESFRPFP